jgi:hypothetical protein
MVSYSLDKKLFLILKKVELAELLNKKKTKEREER